MHSWTPDNLGAFAALTFLVCLTPGAAVLFVVSQAAWRGRGAGLGAALGINTGNLVYYAMSALGLLALIAASNAAFTVLKWAGVAYLIWLGLNAIRDSFRADVSGDAPDAQSAPAASFRDGLLVQLANPKALLYFLALLPQFVDPARHVAGQTAVLALVGCSIEMIVLSGYVLAAGAVRGWMLRRSIRRWVERSTGLVFLALAASAVFWRRGAT